jgi:hypothetical protein
MYQKTFFQSLFLDLFKNSFSAALIIQHSTEECLRRVNQEGYEQEVATVHF